ncbi:MAG: SMC-Scp complex subunit ScpB, partial [Clostridia bacterium]
IIAYKQPVTRLEIEEVRGVSSDYAVQVLLEHKLIEVVGRKDVIGKPLLFGTTDEFLKRFNLSNISDLPNQEEILDRINLIGVEEKSDSLYNEFELPAEEEIPEFLLEEADVEKIESEKLA